MIERDKFVGLMEDTMKFYDKMNFVREVLDLNVDTATDLYIDSVVGFLCELTCDIVVPKHEDIQCAPSKSDLYYTPLVFIYCWDTNFGRVNPIEITVEGSHYKLESAGALWHCLNHLNQWRAHYENDQYIT